MRGGPSLDFQGPLPLFVLQHVIVAIWESIKKRIRLPRIRESDEICCHETAKAFYSQCRVKIFSIRENSFSCSEELTERRIDWVVVRGGGGTSGLRRAAQLDFLLCLFDHLDFIN